MKLGLKYLAILGTAAESVWLTYVYGGFHWTIAKSAMNHSDVGGGETLHLMVQMGNRLLQAGFALAFLSVVLATAEIMEKRSVHSILWLVAATGSLVYALQQMFV